MPANPNTVNTNTVNLDDKIFEFIYSAAMGDATKQMAFGEDKKWLYDCKPFKNSTNALKEFVADVLAGNVFNSQQDYDDRFLIVAKELCDEINNDPRKGTRNFLFGNAQKLINMVMKFFYICTYPTNAVPKTNFRFCHCPMDGKLLNNVWDNKNYLNSQTEQKLGKTKGGFVISWSKQTFDAKHLEHYDNFQEAVRQLASKKFNQSGNPLTPLEYDYYIWQ